MKITIDVADFWIEDDQIELALKNFIIREVVLQINESIKVQIEKAINRIAKERIQKSLTRKIGRIIDRFILEDKVEGRYSKNDLVSVSEYIKQEFNNNSGYSSAKEKITELAKAFGNELKKRYDLLYASQIVATLHENGLMKENVMKMLAETLNQK